MASCSACGGEIESVFRFCPWCAQPQRLKLTEFFRAHAEIEGAHRALRVSRYLGRTPEERHVRFSVWSDTGADRTRVEAAVSLSEDEVDRLSRFLAGQPARLDRPEPADAETIA